MVYEKKHLVLERGVLLEADSQVHTICISVLFFFLICCSLATEKTATEKNAEISFHLVVLHSTPSPSNDWVPKLVIHVQ